MDSLKQYASPWGYQLLERWSPRGRGYSLQVRSGTDGVGAAWVVAGCWERRRCTAAPTLPPLRPH